MTVEVGKAASLFYCRVWQIKKRRSLYVCVCVCVCVYTHIHSRGLTRTHTILLFSHQVKSDSVTPWIAARPASLSLSISQSLSKLVSIDFVMPTISSSPAPFFCLQSFPAPGSFPMSQLFPSGGQRIGASVTSSALPVNIQR